MTMNSGRSQRLVVVDDRASVQNLTDDTGLIRLQTSGTCSTGPAHEAPNDDVARLDARLRREGSVLSRTDQYILLAADATAALYVPMNDDVCLRES